jgi:hypothetical protein
MELHGVVRRDTRTLDNDVPKSRGVRGFHVFQEAAGSVAVPP